jgi:hypothetical protein
MQQALADRPVNSLDAALYASSASLRLPSAAAALNFLMEVLRTDFAALLSAALALDTITRFLADLMFGKPTTSSNYAYFARRIASAQIYILTLQT